MEDCTTLPGSQDGVVTNRLGPVLGLPQQPEGPGAGAATAVAPPEVVAAGHYTGGDRRPVQPSLFILS